MTIKLEPMFRNLLLALEPEPPKSAIIAVQSSMEGLCRAGRVIAVGPEVRDTKVGQKVIATITAGVEGPWGLLIGEDCVQAYFHE